MPPRQTDTNLIQNVSGHTEVRLDSAETQIDAVYCLLSPSLRAWYSFNPSSKHSKAKSLQVTINTSVPNDNCKEIGYQLLAQTLAIE